jgi:hypothetical protein
MERGYQPGQAAEPLCCGRGANDLEPGSYQRDSFADSVLTDSLLSELKKQSSNGCLLCFLEEWDEEEWD